MALFDRNPFPKDDGSVSPWAVVAAIAAAGVLAGIACLLAKPQRYLEIRTRAHASDGMLLPTSCACSEGGICHITVQNTALREITSQAHVETVDGAAASNEVSTTVPVLAKEVCLHIRIQGGDFGSVPEYEDGGTAPHVRSERELIVFLGNIQPSEEVSLRVSVRAGDKV